MSTDEPIFPDDPVLGKYVDNYPSDRLRLLLIGGAALVAVWFVVTVALWQVEANVASIVTVVVLAAATLVIGWLISHLWNREVVLYEHGFSYREGSTTVFIRYADVKTIRQRGERVAYFGGLVRRSTLRCTMITDQDETITLTTLYRRIDQLSLRLEMGITRAVRPAVERQLADGMRLDFGDSLALSAAGLHQNGRDLPWADFAGHQIASRQLVIQSRDGTDWHRARLGDMDNLRLLVDLLRQQQERHDKGQNTP